jgi:hypothetical protein
MLIPRVLLCVVLLSLAVLSGCSEDAELDEPPPIPDVQGEVDSGSDAGPEDAGSEDAGPSFRDTDTTPREKDTGSPPADDIESDDGDAAAPDPCAPATADGRICMPNERGLFGARVVLSGVDCDGHPFRLSTTTDRHGYYQFPDVAPGTHTLEAYSGAFSLERQVTVSSGQQARSPDEAPLVCFDASQVTVAVLEGQFDYVGTLLNGLEVPFEVVGSDASSGIPQPEDGPSELEAARFLADYGVMKSYDMLFIPCGNLWEALLRMREETRVCDPEVARFAVDDMLANLRQFVADGKTLFVSDKARPFVQAAFPEILFFSDHDTSLCGGTTTSAPQQVVQADVISSEMQAVLDTATTAVVIPGGSNNFAVSAPESTTVHFRGNVRLVLNQTAVDAILMITYEPPSGGSVVFTSFHFNSAFYGVPPGPPDYQQRIRELLEFVVFHF